MSPQRRMPTLKNTVERSWVLVSEPVSDLVTANGDDPAIGGDPAIGWLVRAYQPTSGQIGQVEIDWQWTLAREEQAGDVAGFLHTHPPGHCTQPSERDRRTMQAWCSALGKPLFCLIRCGRALSAWRFSPGSPDPHPLSVWHPGPNLYLITEFLSQP